jgi:hypothetical protein
MYWQRFVMQAAGAALGALLALILGLLFNTGTDFARFEIAIYCGVGAIAGWYGGRIAYIVRR